MRVITALILLLVWVTSTYSGDFVSGATTCPTSGNKQVSSTSFNAYTLTVTAKLTNAGFVYIGQNDVTTSTGTALTPGSSTSFNRGSAGVNPATLYFACATNTDAITWIGQR